MSLRLRFRSQNRYARVKAEIHNPSGQVIKLEGVSPPTREESGAAHTEVVRTGRVPERAALGTYECGSVQGLTGDRNWAPIFEDPDFSIRVVERPFHAKSLPRPKRGRFPGTWASVEGGKPKVAGQACCSDKGGQQEYARTYAQILRVVLIQVGLEGLAHCKSLSCWRGEWLAPRAFPSLCPLPGAISGCCKAAGVECR